MAGFVTPKLAILKEIRSDLEDETWNTNNVSNTYDWTFRLAAVSSTLKPAA
jgi:hypothetical protein